MDGPAHRHERVDQAGAEAGAEAQRDGERQRPLPLDARDRQHGRAERQHRADREVDAAGDQDERHADRDDGEGGDLVGERRERDAGEEVIAQRAEERDEQHQHGGPPGQPRSR
jgi:hypothetical protein